ncbi:hypothetical protein Dxin01_03853 [Deinococcus xinjiangensis]|uniref:Prepilin-type N-terminal cleavage/methylation domain-containing protein n=1 Tax=Deinococcus xinjiangensis TaxID=457454 RepID=A0ABP9VHN7_9DEIO
MRRLDGFTLIEMLMICLIIGILVAVLTPNLLGARVAANDAVALNCVHALTQAAQAAKIDDGLSAPYREAAALAQSPLGRPCSDERLTLATQSVSNTEFSYTVRMRGGRLFTVTPTSVNRSN